MVCEKVVVEDGLADRSSDKELSCYLLWKSPEDFQKERSMI
jgi:hypothetical protein